MPWDAETKGNIVKEFAKGENDTGSTMVQIALLTARITNLAGHLTSNKKDKHGQRGLQLMVGQRRRLLKYLARTNYDGYLDITTKLSIRRGQATIR